MELGTPMDEVVYSHDHRNAFYIHGILFLKESYYKSKKSIGD
jgi:hypothetical protein